MSKYLIQDIIPPDRKKHHEPEDKRPSIDPPHHAKAAIKTPVHAKTRPHTAHKAEHPHEEPLVNATPKAVAHEIPEHADDQVIHDELAENPRGMLLEQLYKGNDHANTVAPETPGSWPYNNTNEMMPVDSNNIPPHFPEDASEERAWSRGWLPWIAVPLILVVVVATILNLLGGATISVIAKHDVIPIPDTQAFTAVKNPTDGSLGYSVMKVSLDDSLEVPATGTKTVTVKASGKIVIYNEQAVAQRLIKNTRFQSTAGKIYRISDSITIPKATTPKGGKFTPGSLAVTVYADEAGPDYNTAPTDFSVPGLKDTPQAKKVYARSSGAISGGASGATKSVSDEDLHQASEDLRVSLETKLRSKARGDLAPSQIAYDQSIVVDLQDPKLSTDKASSDNKAVVVESGTLYVVVFDRDALTKAITKALVPTYGGEGINMKNIDALTMSMPETKGDALWKNDNLAFSLKGAPELTWIIDPEAIKKNLLGIQKSSFNSVMSEYSTVERAKANLTPFWKSTFPADPKNITINIVTSIPK